ncbi:MAG: transposase [Candidatus Omnitrophica bacterium]|nr:transposase [Candidatus Omnitrophota bacterium]
MTVGPRLLLENVCYHIMSRGNQRQKTFLDQQDYQEYISRLKKYKTRHGFSLYGFCLMPNHVHLIGEPKQLRSISKLMHALSLSYSIYFNKRYNKVGHLWQDRFKSKVIVKDRYLIDCIQYIEFNPVRARLVKTAQEYPWSSYQERVLSEGVNFKMINQLCI